LKNRLTRKLQYWWEAPEDSMHKAVFDEYDRILSTQSHQKRRYAKLLSRYEQRPVGGLDGVEWFSGINDFLDKEEFEEGITKSVIDSAVAKISSNMPRLVQITNGAVWKQAKNAGKRTLLMDGVFYQQKIYPTAREVFRDACIYDQGLLHIYPSYNQKTPVVERVLPHEIAVDLLDGKYGKPRNMMRHKMVTRSELIAAFPDAKDVINRANLHESITASTETVDDPISVIEAWHLPSGKESDDGLHVITVNTGVVVKETHKRQRFPIIPFRWKTRSLGWDGQGMAEDVYPYQQQHDYLSGRITKLLNNCVIRVFTETGSQVNLIDLSNEDESIPVCEYSGKPPVFSADPGPAPELFHERERVKQAAYEHVGLSQLYSQGKKPPGLNSGVAIREAKDSESERFADVGLAWQEFFINVGESILDAFEDLAEVFSGKEISVNVPTGGTLESVTLGEVDLDRNKYILQVKASSLLPTEISGRLATISDLSERFPQMAPYLLSKLDNPDIADITSMLNANQEAIMMDIAKLESGEQVVPEPFLEKGTAMTLGVLAYNKARNSNAPDDVLEAFRQYLLSVHNLIKQEQQQAQQQAMMQVQQQSQMQPGQMPQAQ
jgi:hypothetical protein